MSSYCLVYGWWRRPNLIVFAYIYFTSLVILCRRCLLQSQSLPFVYPVFQVFRTFICVIWVGLWPFISFILFFPPFFFSTKYESPLVSQMLFIWFRNRILMCVCVLMLRIDIDTEEWDVNKQEKKLWKRNVIHIVAKCFFIYKDSPWLLVDTHSHHKLSRLADPKKPNNGNPFFFHLYFDFFLLLLLFSLSIYLLPSSRSLSISACLKLSLSYSCQYNREREASHFNDTLYSAQFLRSFFRLLLLPNLNIYQKYYGCVSVATVCSMYVMRLFLASL